MAILCLALGIGASATALTLIDATILRPYGLVGAGDLVVAWESDPSRPQDLIEVSLLDFEDWERRSRSFTSMAAFGSSHWPGIGRLSGDPFPIAPRAVTRRFFQTLGRAPMLGRDFVEADLAVTSPAPVMLSHAFWRQRLGASPDVVGATLYIDTEAHRVIGVMPRGFAFPDSPDVWISAERALRDAFADVPLEQQRFIGVLQVIGRLTASASRETASRELNALAFGLHLEHNAKGQPSSVVVMPFTDLLLGRLGPRLGIALGMTAIVLLFACANVAALRLAHLRERSGELVAHLCVGATRGRLAARLLGEMAPLAAMSALAAGVICRTLETWLRQWPTVASSGIDLAEFRTMSSVAVAGFSVIAWLLVSAAPALAAVASATSPTYMARGWRGALSSAMASRSIVRGSRSTSVLLLAQAALAVCLVAMASGAFRMFARLAGTDVGFSTSGVTAIDIAVPAWKYEAEADRVRLVQRLVAVLEDLPGVDGAAGVSVRPFRFGEIADGILVRRMEDVAAGLDAPIGASRVIVSPGYFAVMNIEVMEGRAFVESDRTTPQAIAVVSRTLARTLWGESSAVGRTLQFVTARGWQTHAVVGVVDDVRSRVIDRPALEVYVPPGRGGPVLGSYVIRHAGHTVITDLMIRRALRSVDPELALERVQTSRAVVDSVIAPARLLTTAMTVLGVTALMLLALGIFGAAATALRGARGEVAIRQAVGATPFEAARAPLRSLLVALTIGVFAGVAIAPGALGGLTAMGVADASGMAAALAMAGIMVAAAAALAVGVTLRRAMQSSPAELLRAE